MRQWRPVKKSYSVVPSVFVNMGRGQGSIAAPTTPVRELTVAMGRLRITTCDPVATTTRVQHTSKRRRAQRRVFAGAPTRTDSKIAPRLNLTADDVLSTEGEVVRRTEDDHRNLEEQDKGVDNIDP